MLTHVIITSFHVSYWLGKFNMFFTVRYLAIIGVVLLISGNKHLNAMAKDRKIITAENHANVSYRKLITVDNYQTVPYIICEM